MNLGKEDCLIQGMRVANLPSSLRLEWEAIGLWMIIQDRQERRGELAAFADAGHTI